VIAPLLLATQLVVWHSYRADEQRALEQCVAVWNRAHADVKVEALALPYDGFASKLEAAIPRGNGPDLVIFGHSAIGDWARAGLIEPFADTLPAHEFLDGTVEPLRAGGKLWGMPLAFKSLALFYRKDLVARPPATTDELVALARRTKATRPAGHYALAYEAGASFYHAPWLHGFGGQLLDGSGRPALDSQGAIASVAFVEALAAEELLPPESTGVVAAQLFNDGRAAITINGPWFVGDIAPGVPFGVAPLPTVSATGKPAAPLVEIEALLMPARGPHGDPQAAVAFARWLAGGEAARIRASIGRQTVAALAAWDDPAIAHDPILSAFRAQLAATVPMPNAPAIRQVWEPLNQALRKVLRGAASARPAMTEAQKRVTEALRPAPLAVSGTPYAVLFGLVAMLAAAWAVRRGRARGGLEAARAQSAAYAYLAPAAVAMLVLVFVPFAVGAGMSLFWHDAGHWTFIGLSNFADILASRDAPVTDPLSFYFTLAVTALWTVANVSLHVIIGVTLALLLRDPLLKLRGVYRVLLIVPWAVPNYITALIWKGMFQRQFGAINGLLALVGLHPISWFSRFWTAFAANVATNVWLGFPFMMVVTLGALSRIPRELEEAAALDGATRWQRLRYVVLPLLRPALLPSVLLGAVWTFNMFNIVFLVSGGEPDGATDILVSQAYRWAFSRGHRYGYAAAYAVLIFAILAAQTFFAQKDEATA
jgi:arabinogalactan oligomer / maltooligosaccharide transport system substrate-binding protein/arabinogalactan oligomer / maltooligosaccharide transport system permease protein